MTAARNWQLSMPTPEAYWIDRVLYDVHHKPDHLDRYRRDPEAYMSEIPLPLPMKHAIRDNAIGTLYLAGANPYLLRAHCLGLRIPEGEFLAALREIGTQAAEAGDPAASIVGGADHG